MAFIRNCCSVTTSYVCDAEERQLGLGYLSPEDVDDVLYGSPDPRRRPRWQNEDEV